MKTSVLHRVLSLIMAVFIFISSSGISLDIHYCGNEVFDYSLIGETKSCKELSASLDDSTELRVKRSGCCSFDHFNIETSDEYKFSDFDKEAITLVDKSFTTLITTTFVENSILVPEFRITVPPPEIKTNELYLEIETFLI